MNEVNNLSSLFPEINPGVPLANQDPIFMNGNSVRDQYEPKDETVRISTINRSQLTPIDIATDIPQRADPVDPFVAKAFGDLDIAIEREKQKVTELQEELMDRLYDESLDDEDSDNDHSVPASEDPEDVDIMADVEETVSSFVQQPKTFVICEDHDVKVRADASNVDVVATAEVVSADEADDYTSSNMAKDIDEEFGFGDIEDKDAEEQDDQKEAERIIHELKDAAKDKIVPVKDKIDLSKFTISTKPVSASKVFRIDNAVSVSKADWVLFTAKKPFTMSALSGAEIVDLNPSNANQNRLNRARNTLQILYNHIISANKPDFESWLKITKFHDIDHLYFAAYMATFQGSNFMAYSCPNKHVFLNDYKFEDMIKYENDEVKAKTNAILRGETLSSEDSNTIELRQISDNYVVGLKAPSIYDAIIQTASMSDKFLQRYNRFIDTISYIDAIYFINRETGALEPVDVEPKKGEEANRSIARKIKTYFEILYNRITSDQYYDLTSYMSKIDTANSAVHYIIPEATCPKCGALISAEDRSADSILFTRHQLKAFVNM